MGYTNTSKNWDNWNMIVNSLQKTDDVIKIAMVGKYVTLADSYVKQLLCKRSFLRSKDIPQELIEAKRGQLKLKRILENK